MTNEKIIEHIEKNLDKLNRSLTGSDKVTNIIAATQEYRRQVEKRDNPELTEMFKLMLNGRLEKSKRHHEEAEADKRTYFRPEGQPVHEDTGRAKEVVLPYKEPEDNKLF